VGLGSQPATVSASSTLGGRVWWLTGSAAAVVAAQVAALLWLDDWEVAL